ncbi:MAG: sulfite exporter TauE/SafE family protein [Propionibacterium sp.]|nr:sulfite exporter TauE/SafE family protein [Propionibacterium sp.]
MSLPLLVLCAVAVLCGAIAQRVTGLGFALVSSPFLVMALGPIEGVVVANLCGVGSGLFSLWFTWRLIDLRRTMRIVAALLVGFAPGMVVIRVVPPDWLAVLVASIVLIALLVTLTVRPGRTKDSWVLSSAAGLASGFMGVTASVGGPPLAIYGRLTAWDNREFAAAMQAVTPFILIAVVTAPSFPSFAVSGWVTLAVALIAGVIIGNQIAPHVSNRLAGRLVMTVAMVGTLLALGRAILGLVSPSA